MFIKTTSAGYDRHDQQYATGLFLVLVQPDSQDGHKSPLRALARVTRLGQFGQFMMGTCRAFNHQITLSGAYGNDGLPCTVPQDVYNKATPVPPHLVEAWNKGGGWNSAGSEATAMREWALQALTDTARK